MTQHQRVGETSAARPLPHQDIAPAHAAGPHADQHLTPLRRGRRVDVAENKDVGRAVSLRDDGFHDLAQLTLTSPATNSGLSSSRTMAAIQNGNHRKSGS